MGAFSQPSFPYRSLPPKMHIGLWNPEKVPLGLIRSSKAKFKKKEILIWGTIQTAISIDWKPLLFQYLEHSKTPASRGGAFFGPSFVQFVAPFYFPRASLGSKTALSAITAPAPHSFDSDSPKSTTYLLSHFCLVNLNLESFPPAHSHSRKT